MRCWYTYFSNKNLTSIGRDEEEKRKHTHGTMSNICQLICGLNNIELTSLNSLIFYLCCYGQYLSFFILLTGTLLSEIISKTVN